MNSFDLHMHSCYSNDGEFTPQELIHMADEAHLTTIALSDHNTPKGIADMVRLGEAKGIRVIPAMEFDTLFESWRYTCSATASTMSSLIFKAFSIL